MAGEKILLVEDNPVNRRLAEFLLRSQGYQVREAFTAEEVFEIIKTDRPDLILMDLQLPGMDGLQAARKLKQDAAMRDIPIVAVTSYAMKGDRERAHEAGCAGYVTKPIDKTTLLEEIATQLAKSRRSASEKENR
jgi:two-component system, cell cycle response regulator DivK